MTHQRHAHPPPLARGSVPPASRGRHAHSSQRGRIGATGGALRGRGGRGGRYQSGTGVSLLGEAYLTLRLTRGDPPLSDKPRPALRLSLQSSSVDAGRKMYSLIYYDIAVSKTPVYSLVASRCSRSGCQPFGCIQRLGSQAQTWTTWLCRSRRRCTWTWRERGRVGSCRAAADGRSVQRLQLDARDG